jgi:hypothetical protein
MKRVLVLLCSVVFVLFADAQVNVAGSSVGNGSYATLGAAFTAIGVSATGNITITVSGNTTEAAGGASLGAGAWTSLTIAPSGGPWTISGAATAGTPLVTLNGADNVTVNGGGNLIFSNTTVSATTGTSTVKLVADATNNTFNNVTFLTAATMAAGTNGGAVWVSTGTSTGNDNNSFQSCKFSSSTTNSGVLFSAIGSTTNVNIENANCTINNCEFYDYFLASGTQAGIYVSTGNTNWTISNNKIYQSATRTITTSSTVYGIYCVNAGATALGENFSITSNTIGYNNNSGTGTMTYDAGTTAGGFTGVLFQGSNTSTGTNAISNNIISNISWTASGASIFNGISTTSITSTTVGHTLNIKDNQIKNIAFVGATGQLTGILSGYSPAVTISGNTLDNISRSGSGIFYGMNYAGTTTSNFTFNANVLTNLSSTSATNTSAFYGIYSISAPAIETFTSNIIDGMVSSSTAAQTVLGIYNITATTGNKTCQNNIVRNISLPSSSTGTIYGLRIAYLGATSVVSGNTVYNLSGGTNIFGILVGTANVVSTNCSVYNNKIYDLSTDITAGATFGLHIAPGTTANSITYNVYNNIIGRLSANSTSLTTDAIRGISIISANVTSNIYLHYNTVYLTGAASSGTDFGSSAIFHTYNATATTANLIMKNNIFVNSYPSKGLGVSAVFKRSASTDLANFSSTTSNNLYYGTNIYNDGTNTDVTIGTFATRVTPRAAGSFSENPTFVNTATGASTNFLHIDPTVATQIESGGLPISVPASVLVDFDADARNASTPDIGADEFAGIISVPMTFVSSTTEQVTGNAFTYANQAVVRVKIVTTGGTNPLQLTSLTLNANGTTDIANINTATAKVYYTGNSTAFTTGVLFGSTTPTIANFIISGTQTLTEGDNYFWLAYDVAGASPNGNLIDGECVDLTVGSTYVPTVTAPSGSRSIVVAMTGDYLIGAGQTAPNYTTLTNAIADLQNRGASGQVNFKLQNDYNSAGEIFPIVISEFPGASASNTVTIKPDAGVTASVTGAISSGALIKLNGADYVTIDGSNSGGNDRSLTITNTATTAPTVILLTSFGAGSGATHNTIKNCNISTGTQTTIGYGIAASGLTPGTVGADNDFNSINNNSINNCAVGVYAIGTAAVASGGDDNTDISGNTITYNGTLSNAVAIKIGQTLNSTVAGNTVNYETTATLIAGISLETGTSNTTVSKNLVSKVVSTNIGASSIARGIVVGTAQTGSAITITNNVIYNVLTTRPSSTVGYGHAGILLGAIGPSATVSTTTGGVSLYNNSVYLSGNSDYAIAAVTYALFVGSGVTSVDCKNNSLQNSTVNIEPVTGVNSKAYAIYSVAANTVYNVINYNDYYVSGSQGTLGYIGSARTTLAAIQTGFGQNVNSIAADPLYNSPTNLLPNLGSPLLGVGNNTPGVTDDFLGTSRNNPPSIGAYEAAGDFAGPVMLYTPLASTLSTTDRTIVVNIQDISGVASGASAPRIYYRKNGGAFTNANATSIAGNDYTFTISAPVTAGDLIEYYFASQDLIGTPNASTSPFGGSGVTPPGTTAPATFNSYLIGGTYTWSGGGAGSWASAASWTPSRTNATVLDNIIFDGVTTVVSNVPTQSIASLVLQNNANVQFTSSATATLTLDAAGPVLNIANGSILDITSTNALTLAFGTGATGSVAGTLGTSGVEPTYPNIIDFTGAVVTVSGTLKNGGTFTGNTNTTLLLATNSTYIHARNAGTMPVASFAANPSNVNLTVTGAVGSSTTPPVTCKNLVYNCPAQTIAAFTFSSTLTTVSGTFRLVSSGSGAFQFGTAVTTQIAGTAVVEGGKLRFAGGTGLQFNGGITVQNGAVLETTANTTFSSTGTIINTGATMGSSSTFVLTTNCTGNFSNAGTIDGGAGTGNVLLNFNGTGAQSFTNTNAISNKVNLTVNKASGLFSLLSDYTVNTGSTLTMTAGSMDIAAGKTLTIAGSADFNAKSITLKSDATGSARIAAITGSLTNATAVTVQRYFAGGASSGTPGKRGFRFIAHPFNASPFLSSLITGGMSVTGNGGSGNGFTNNPAAGATNNPSAFSYDPTQTGAGSVTTVGGPSTDPGWIAYTNATTETWNKMKGIRVLFRGTAAQGLDGTSSYTLNPLTLTMTGTINTGVQTFTLPATADATTRWSLVGNPYPSQINIQGLLNTKYAAGAGNIGAAAYVFNPDKTGTTRGGYDMIDITSNGGGTPYILPTYGVVLVQNTVNTTHDISFAEGDKTAGTPNLAFRNQGANNALVVTMQDANGMELDKTYLRFDKASTEAFESRDGSKMLNEYSLYTVASGKQMLAIDCRPEPTSLSQAVVPLGVQTATAKSLIFTIDEMDMPAGVTAYLKDKFLNVQETITGTGFNYAFSTTSNPASSGASRFEIVFSKSAVPVLPIATNFSIKLSPNPVTDIVKVAFSNVDKANTTITMVNAEGKIVKTIDAGTVQTGNININVKGLAKGTYYITLNNGTEKRTEKLQVQ